MNLDKTGLVLEGGGLRGIYTSGVLRLFMDRGITIPYVIGVSMGACNGANYVSCQPERNRIVNTRFTDDPRYLSYKRLLFKGELFGMDFLFDTLPNDLVPFDNEMFQSNSQRFIVGVTDCETGEAVYFDKHSLEKDFLIILRASCSLPFLAPAVQFRGQSFMDGGISDSIPLEKSIADGNRKHVLILTQPRGYRKKQSSWTKLVQFRYPKFKGLSQAIETRYQRYNETADAVDELEKKKEIFVIRPQIKLSIKRAERNREKLLLGYDTGYYDAMVQTKALLEYLQD